MKKALILFFICLLPYNLDAYAQTGPFRIHYRERPPEMIIGQGNIPKGPVINLVTELISSLGKTISWKGVPWARTIKLAELGRLDLLLRHSMTIEREVFLHPILLGYEEREVYFLIPVQSSLSITSYEDLYDIEVAVNRGSFYFEKFNADTKIKKSEQNSLETQFKLLEGNRVEVVITNDIRAFEAIAQNRNLSPRTVFKKAQYIYRVLNGRYFSIPKKSPYAHLYKQLNCHVLEMRKNGRITEIYQSSNVKPYIQDFEHPTSKKQADTCNIG